ncbi:MAG: translation initiation factor IF-2, partial [Acidobacteria bacterium]|nr:translation initiation factor IF-2 [Acidobacteriota bacterium]
VRLRIIHSGVGAINESDVLLASASNAVIIGFNVRPDRKAAELAQQEGVDIRLHNVIYEVLDEIRQAAVGLLEPTVKETIVGHAEVRETFRIPRVGMVAGCYVLDGKVSRDAEVRVLRDNVVIYKSKVGSLRRFKEDVKEVGAGYECGVVIANFADVKVGDVLEVFAVEKVPSEVSV